MENAKVRCSILVLAFVVVSGCKVLDDKAEDYPAGQNWSAETSGSPPAIWGEPVTDVLVNSQYIFAPEASDADGDVLEFSIVNKPVWASFDTVTGRLEGTPTTSDLGPSDTIKVSVTDETSIAALSPFTIAVEAVGPAAYSLAWITPTKNEDGTPLTDLAGYRIYYGTSSGSYSKTIDIDSPGMTTYVIGNMVPGNYYLVMTSLDSEDMESRYTAELEFQPET